MKTILITGASSGIGRSLALAYVERGYTVFAGGRDEKRLLSLKAHAHIPERIIPFVCDVNNPEQLSSLTFQREPIELPLLDMLILNAGDCEYIDDAVNFDGVLFSRVIHTNLISVGHCLAAWLPLVKKQGQLIFTSSSAAFLPLPRAQAYGASKAALTYLAKTLSIDLKKHAIDVSVIHPGFVNTPLTKKNTFSMPGIVSTEQAAYYILEGIDKRKVEINFPKVFIFLMRLTSMLPFGLWRRIAGKMAPPPAPVEDSFTKSADKIDERT